MDVQDCKYYEARAKDVNLEDITSSEQNAAILARLRDNDPTFTAISIEDGPQVESNFVAREGDCMGWLGYFVGRSKQVKELYIYSFPDSLNIDPFLRGVGHNRSIQSLHINIDLGENFQSLVPLLENDSNLSRLTFDNFIGLQCAHNIALMLGQQSTLKYLNFEETNLMDEMLVEIAAALSSQPQLEELDLGSNNIARNGCVALGIALEGLKNPNLTVLYLDNNAIDDEGLHALVAGMKNCHNLTTLHLNGNELITQAGLRSLSALFQSDSCRLEHLDLDELNIDDDGVSILAAGQVSLSTLKRLHISDNSIGDEGLQALLVGGLASLNLEELHLSRNSFSPSGLRSLRNWVQSATRLNALSVCNNNINDEGLQCLVEGITNCCSLKTLGLSYNRLITSAGLRSLAPFFQSDNCCMKELSLWGIHFGDDGAVALADGLIGNESLTTLQFDSPGITSRGWAAFSRLLCDASSVNNTYLSNHTLVKIGYGYYMRNTHSDIIEYLELNKALNCDADFCKILKNHPDFDIKPLFHWNLKCLPLLVTWLEKAGSYLGLSYVKESTRTFQCRQLSTVYKFVRGMPLLTVDGYRSQKKIDIQSKSKKRKFDLTL